MIRHAEAEGNLYRRANGQFDGKVTRRGEMQIAQLAKRFENEKIDAVYASDLSRTCLTAEAIYKPFGLPLNKDKRLREVNMGEWEDEPWGNLGCLESGMLTHFNLDPAKWSVEGSESYQTVIERVKECLCEIAEAHKGQTVAVFSHGFAIRSLLSELMGIKSHETRKISYCDNTAVALLVYENGALTIEYHNDNSHLSDDVSTFAHQNWWRGTSPQYWEKENLSFFAAEAKRDEEMLSLCDRGVCSAYAVFLDGEPVGIVGLDTEKDHGENAGWIDCIFVKPEYIDKGYEIQLIGQGISKFRKLGRKKLRFNASVNDTEYYLNFGFRRFAETPDGVVMEVEI